MSVTGLTLPSDFAVGFGASIFVAAALVSPAFISVFAASSRAAGMAMALERIAPDKATGNLVIGKALASAVRVCSCNSAVAGAASVMDLAPLSCPTVDLNSRSAAEFAGFVGASASDILSPFAGGGASAFGSSAATGSGTIFCAKSSGCEKPVGIISSGVTTTRAPILVQPYIFTAKAIGIRIQPCDAG